MVGGAWANHQQAETVGISLIIPYIQFLPDQTSPLFFVSAWDKFSHWIKLQKVCVSEGWNGKRLKNMVSLHVVSPSKKEGDKKGKKIQIFDVFVSEEVPDPEFIVPFLIFSLDYLCFSHIVTQKWENLLSEFDKSLCNLAQSLPAVSNGQLEPFLLLTELNLFQNC